MRALLFAVAVAFSPPALAQEGAFHIPFAPATPAAFNIEMRTSYRDEEGETEEWRASYNVDLRGAAPSYEAVLTVLSAEGEDAHGFDPALLIGFPGELVVVLGPAGEPVSVSDWPRVRDKLEELGALLSPVARKEPRLAAATLATPLAMLAMCQNLNLPVGAPETNEFPPSSHAAISTALRTSREIQSVDSDAGVARVVSEVVLESSQESAAPGAEVIQSMTTHAECVVDLRSGIAQTAVVEIVTSGVLSRATLRMEIAVTPLSR